MLFHKQIYLPPEAKALIGRNLNLSYSHHAKLACVNDRYGIISKPPFQIGINLDNLIEVETENSVIVKVVVRQKYDSKFDIALAISIEGKNSTVKSVWLNDSSDKHFTLDRSKYQPFPKSLGLAI